MSQFYLCFERYLPNNIPNSLKKLMLLIKKFNNNIDLRLEENNKIVHFAQRQQFFFTPLLRLRMKNPNAL